MVHSSLASNLVGLTTAYSPCLRTPRHTPRHRYTAQAGPDIQLCACAYTKRARLSIKHVRNELRKDRFYLK